MWSKLAYIVSLSRPKTHTNVTLGIIKVCSGHTKFFQEASQNVVMYMHSKKDSACNNLASQTVFVSSDDCITRKSNK